MNFLNVNYFKDRGLLILLMMLLYFITAINSNGFYFADEHFQIIEFSNFLLGNNLESDLAWEYNAKIRSAIQPFIGFYLLKLGMFFSDSPYDLAFCLRLITGVFSVLVLIVFISRTEKLFLDEKHKMYYWLISILLCYLPFMNVRFSAETWSGLLLVLCFLILQDIENDKNRFRRLGVIFGVAFLFRFQTAFSFFGVFLWLFFIKKVGLRDLLRVLSSFIIILIFGILIDYVFYDELIFTAFNYFLQGINADEVGRFGLEPWYFYITQIILEPVFFVGIPTLMALIVFVLKRPKHYLTWMVVPFIFFHCLVPHKEIRFLLPLINFVPFVLVYFFTQIEIKRLVVKRIFQFFLSTAVVFNLILLILLAIKPNGPGRLDHTKYLFDNYNDIKINLFYQKDDYPFTRDSWGLTMNFYRQESLETFPIEDIFGLNERLCNVKNPSFLLINKGSLDENEELINSDKWELVNESLPIKLVWLRYLESFGVKVPKSNLFLYLFKYKSSEELK